MNLIKLKFFLNISMKNGKKKSKKIIQAKSKILGTACNLLQKYQNQSRQKVV